MITKDDLRMSTQMARDIGQKQTAVKVLDSMEEVLRQLYGQRYQVENFTKRQRQEWEDVSRYYEASWGKLIATVDQNINKKEPAIEM